MLPQSNLMLEDCMISEQQLVLSQHWKHEEPDFNIRKLTRSGSSRVDEFDSVKVTQAKSRKSGLFISIKTIKTISHRQSWCRQYFTKILFPNYSKLIKVTVKKNHYSSPSQLYPQTHHSKPQLVLRILNLFHNIKI